MYEMNEHFEISIWFIENLDFISLKFFRQDSNISHSDAVTYASFMVILNAIGALTINQLFITGYHNGMKVRIAVCSIIYRKVYQDSHVLVCKLYFIPTKFL